MSCYSDIAKFGTIVRTKYKGPFFDDGGGPGPPMAMAGSRITRSARNVDQGMSKMVSFGGHCSPYYIRGTKLPAKGHCICDLTTNFWEYVQEPCSKFVQKCNKNDSLWHGLGHLHFSNASARSGPKQQIFSMYTRKLNFKVDLRFFMSEASEKMESN